MRQKLPATWLVGKVVRLRPLESEDVPLLRRYGIPVDAKGTIFIIQTHAGKDVGAIGMAVRGWHASVGVRLRGKAQWRDGTAADALRLIRRGAFRSMPLVRMDAILAAKDVEALRAYRSAGFKREGTLRSAYRARRRYTDAAIVSALHDG